MPATARLTTTNLIPLLLAQGFPEPVPEYHFALPERQFRFDLCWPAYWLALEREGNTWKKGQSRHTTGVGYRNDVDKYNESSLRGWTLLRATADMMEDGSVWPLLERGLRQKGWKPAP